MPSEQEQEYVILDQYITPGLDNDEVINNNNQQQQPKAQPVYVQVQNENGQPQFIQMQPQYMQVQQQDGQSEYIQVQQQYIPQVTQQDVQSFQPAPTENIELLFSGKVYKDKLWSGLYYTAIVILAILTVVAFFQSFGFSILFGLIIIFMFAITPRRYEIYGDRFDIILGFNWRHSTKIQDLLEIEPSDSAFNFNYFTALKLATSFSNRVIIFRKNHCFNTVVFSIENRDEFIQFLRSIQSQQV